jgi:putative DNA-invertase from lambdoid prophage Rac
VVVKLDRLGRDTLDVISTIQKLIEKGVVVVVLGLGTLDRSPQSNLTMTMLVAISQFERELISERTKAKLTQLKAEGVKLGRPAKFSDQSIRAKAASLFDSGLSWRKVAGELGVALSTLQRLMKSA